MSQGGRGTWFNLFPRGIRVYQLSDTLRAKLSLAVVQLIERMPNVICRHCFCNLFHILVNVPLFGIALQSRNQ